MFGRITSSLALAVSVSALTGCVSADALGVDYEGADLYHGFTLLDPETRSITEGAYLMVRDGVILETGSGAPPVSVPDERRHDLSGVYALPGLVDGHAHLTAGPHRMRVVDGQPVLSMDSVDEITQFHARIALAFGVTTVRNPAGNPVANAAYDARVRAGDWIGPDAFHAGAAIAPPPLGGDAFVYPQNEAEWQAEAERQAALGMTYLKLYTQLSPEEIETGVRVAHQHGLKAIAHLDGVSWTYAIQAGVDGLEHALPTSADLIEPDLRAEFEASRSGTKYTYRWFELANFDGPLVREMVERAVERQVVTNMTLVVNELQFNADRLDDIYPPSDRAYEHPETSAQMLQFLKIGAATWSAEDFERARAVMPKTLEFARRLHGAGALMLIGSDGHGGGPLFIRELELHVEAGIPLWEVLFMATSGAADIMGIAERTGRVLVGREADVVFLSANPLEDISNVGAVHAVLNNGEFHLAATLLGDSK